MSHESVSSSPETHRQTRRALLASTAFVPFAGSVSGATARTIGDGAGCSGRWEQPADLVIVTAFILENVRLMLLSNIGKPYDARSGEGVVGRNFSHQTSRTRSCSSMIG